MKRRHFVKSSAAASLLLTPFSSLLAARSLSPTPSDYEGPYYPVGPRQPSNDLITGTLRGDELTLKGAILTTDAKPRTNHRIEIWQTDSRGRYKHPRDTSPGKRWDDFLYWGEAYSDEQGHFDFRTYVPGAYGRRPAHIHYKVWQGEKLLLTSQIYFSQLGGAANASRHASANKLQTVKLETLDKTRFMCSVRVVI